MNTSLQSEINVTPLVDVCLVLLIIFMVVTPMIVSGVPVKLPVAKTAASVGDATRQLPITVKEDGTLYVDAVVLRREQLDDELRQRHDAHPERPVAVRGDARVPYGDVVRVLDACRRAGFDNVALVSSPPAPAAAATRR